MSVEQDHSSLVKELIDYFIEKELNVIYANYRDYKTPLQIKRHRPDVLAIDRKTGLGYIGQAKLCSELSDKITREQFEDFPRMLMRSGKSAKSHLPFYIAVPKECESKVKQTFEHFDIPWKENIHVITF